MESSPVGCLQFPEAMVEAATRIDGDRETTRITDLPSAIVGAILCRLPNPVDVASAFKASRLFWEVARSAPFRLRLRPAWYQDGGSIVCGIEDTAVSSRTSFDAQKLAGWTRAALGGIRCGMPNTRELDLTGCPILDDDIAAVLFDLHCLESLILDGCQKLTSSVARALVVSVRSGPRVLSLQRCFRLGPAAAGNLLAAAAVGGSRLQAILFSHLDSLELPQESPHLKSLGGAKENDQGASLEVVTTITRSVAGTGLRVLALHNCANLGHSELAAISRTCPYLEVLMLGGSVDGLELSRVDTLSQDKLMAATSALVGVTEHLMRLRILEITFFTAPVLQAVREQVSKTIHVWDFCNKFSVAAAACVAANLKGVNQYVLGETWDASPMNFKSTHSTIQGCSPSGLDEDYLKDTEIEIANSQEDFVRKTGVALSHFCQPDQGMELKWDCVAEDVLMALRTGTTCSNISKRTPLHVAAASGEASVVANLLSVGVPAKGMKDSKGATALFLAAENGHALVCEHLLRSGADVLASNRNGETPLYIAALKGHSAAVEVMLNHCHNNGVNWQDADMYGDGWTPLMAATLADRQDVGKLLLNRGSFSRSAVLEGQTPTVGEADMLIEDGCQTAVKDTRSDSVKTCSCLSRLIPGDTKDDNGDEVPRSGQQLLDAQNRYGQTALHIAARQGSVWFVTNLLHAGASVDTRDEYRLRAVDVARKQKHTLVETILKRWEGNKSGHEVPKASTSKQRARARKKAASARKFRTEDLENCSSPVTNGDTPDVGNKTEWSDASGEEERPGLPDSPNSIVSDWVRIRFNHLEPY